MRGQPRFAEIAMFGAQSGEQKPRDHGDVSRDSAAIRGGKELASAKA